MAAHAMTDYLAATDEELMLAYQKGDAPAFDYLLSRHQKDIFHFLYRYLGDRGQAEEALQDVFERVIRAAHSYTPQARFSTWVYTIARNYSIDSFRKKKHRKLVSMDEPIYSSQEEDGSTLGETVPDQKPLPDSEASGLDLQLKMEEALARVNPDQREVFLLRHQQGLPFEQIAEIANVSVNTVKSRMRYALLALQEEFKKWGITDPKGK